MDVRKKILILIGCISCCVFLPMSLAIDDAGALGLVDKPHNLRRKRPVIDQDILVTDERPLDPEAQPIIEITESSTEHSPTEDEKHEGDLMTQFVLVDADRPYCRRQYADSLIVYNGEKTDFSEEYVCTGISQNTNLKTMLVHENEVLKSSNIALQNARIESWTPLSGRLVFSGTLVGGVPNPISPKNPAAASSKGTIAHVVFGSKDDSATTISLGIQVRAMLTHRSNNPVCFRAIYQPAIEVVRGAPEKSFSAQFPCAHFDPKHIGSIVDRYRSTNALKIKLMSHSVTAMTDADRAKLVAESVAHAEQATQWISFSGVVSEGANDLDDHDIVPLEIVITPPKTEHNTPPYVPLFIPFKLAPRPADAPGQVGPVSSHDGHQAGKNHLYNIIEDQEMAGGDLLIDTETHAPIEVHNHTLVRDPPSGASAKSSGVMSVTLLSAFAVFAGMVQMF